MRTKMTYAHLPVYNPHDPVGSDAMIMEMNLSLGDQEREEGDARGGLGEEELQQRETDVTQQSTVESQEDASEAFPLSRHH